MSEILYGALEAGGTKMVCAVGTGPDDLRDVVRIPTTKPDETLAAVVGYFRAAEKSHGRLAALGIGCFGPVDLDRGSDTWGFITTTPKPGWAQVSVAPFLKKELGIPVAFDTDVNAAAYGEYVWGFRKEVADLVYMTVGTGIGAGFVVGGNLVHGLVHPEAGHMRIPGTADDFRGSCPFHERCLEGLASGPALQKRWGVPASDLGPDHPAWAQEALYLAQAAHAFLSVVSPQRIIFGGGVMDQPHLLPLVRTEFLKLNNGYIRHPSLESDGLSRFLVAPTFGNRAGIVGALALAENLVGSASGCVSPV